MALSQTQQIKQLIQDAKHILITFRKNGSGDAVGSALALLLFLEKFGKTVDVVSDGFILKQQFTFLKRCESISPQFAHLQKFIITLDVQESGVEELSYDLKNEKLRIFVTPKQGFLTRQHVRTAQTDFKYDLIFVIDSPDLDSLGSLFQKHGELFYKVPLVNIDHDPGNERFGQINYVNFTTSSTSEILFDMMQQVGDEYLDKDIATAVLTGMITQTHSFKADLVKPHSLKIASALMSMGADREQIVKHLYQTRTIPTLKLWGYALTHLQHVSEKGFVWSTITRDDFVRCGAHESDLQDVIHELISNSPEAKVTLLLHEHISNGNGQQTIHGLLHTDNTFNAHELVQRYDPEGTKQDVSFKIHGKNLKEAEDEVKGTILKQI